MRIARVFPSRTSLTPDDSMAWALLRRKDGTPIWETALPPFLAMPDIDEVHISVTFTWDMWAAEILEKAWRAVGVPVRVGGPALGMRSEECIPGMYIKKGCTFTSRGCPNNCWFCSVPKREGKLREQTIREGWNIMDDNFLACSEEHVRSTFAMLAIQDERALFTGGLEARILKSWHAAMLREIHAKRMYFAFDTQDDYEPLVCAGKIMQQEGHRFESHSMACYCLIGYQGDTFEKAEKRLIDTVRAGFMPYAMLYRGPDGAKDESWGRFQREWLRPEILGTKVRQIRKEAV